MPPNLLSPAKTADQACVSVSMIYPWCDERRLPHYRAGGRGKRGKILISPLDLDAFMASLRVEGDELTGDEDLRVIR